MGNNVINTDKEILGLEDYNEAVKAVKNVFHAVVLARNGFGLSGKDKSELFDFITSKCDTDLKWALRQRLKLV